MSSVWDNSCRCRGGGFTPSLAIARSSAPSVTAATFYAKGRKEEGRQEGDIRRVRQAAQGRLLGPEGEEAVLSQLAGEAAEIVLRESLGFLSAVRPLNKVPEVRC